jgi:hypothetical protein
VDVLEARKCKVLENFTSKTASSAAHVLIGNARLLLGRLTSLWELLAC